MNIGQDSKETQSRLLLLKSIVFDPLRICEEFLDEGFRKDIKKMSKTLLSIKGDKNIIFAYKWVSFGHLENLPINKKLYDT